MPSRERQEEAGAEKSRVWRGVHSNRLESVGRKKVANEERDLRRKEKNKRKAGE